MPDGILCGSQGHAFTPTIGAICIGHRAFHLLLGTTPNYDPPGPPHADDPAIGTLGGDILARSDFDGWGYVRLLDANTMQQVDAYAIDEAMDPDFAQGFGDLSVHEVAVDPYKAPNLAHLSYYAGGMRVIEYGPSGLKEVGHHIDEDGNNFWASRCTSCASSRSRPSSWPATATAASGSTSTRRTSDERCRADEGRPMPALVRPDGRTSFSPSCAHQ